MAANKDQVEFWNSPSGEKWVTFQSELDGLFAEITDLLFDCAAPSTGERVLDVGCGCGTTSLMYGERVGVGGAVVGVDVSEPLLAQANAARDRAAVDNVAFVRADAQVHDFEGASFDLVASRFGVMFFDDPYAAFRNLASALKPGGRCVFICWDGLTVNPWFSIPRAAAVDRLGAPAPTQPRDPGPMAFAERDYVRDILESAGFTLVAVDSVETTLRHAGGVAAAAQLSARLGPAARIIKERDGTPEDIAAIAQRIESDFAPFATSGGIAVPALLNLVEARKGSSVP